MKIKRGVIAKERLKNHEIQTSSSHSRHPRQACSRGPGTSVENQHWMMKDKTGGEGEELTTLKVEQ